LVDEVDHAARVRLHARVRPNRSSATACAAAFDNWPLAAHSRCSTQTKESNVPLTLERSEGFCTIRLDGAIDIANAAELKSLLVQALASGNLASPILASPFQVQVSLGAATDLDVTAVQLLWAATRQAKTSGVDFSILEPVPESVTAALLLAGFEELAATADTPLANEVNPCRP
jgi:anti-anti-sigma regulatory factor